MTWVELLNEKQKEIMKTLNRKMTIQPGLELKAVKERGNEDSDDSFPYESSDSESSSESCNRK